MDCMMRLYTNIFKIYGKALHQILVGKAGKLSDFFIKMDFDQLCEHFLKPKWGQLLKLTLEAQSD